MKVTDKYYPNFECSLMKIDSYEPQIKLEDGFIWVEARDKKQGKSFWIKADSLKTKTDGERELFNQLLWWIGWIGKEKLGLSKAEIKRRLVKSGVISK